MNNLYFYDIFTNFNDFKISHLKYSKLQPVSKYFKNVEFEKIWKLINRDYSPRMTHFINKKRFEVAFWNVFDSKIVKYIEQFRTIERVGEQDNLYDQNLGFSEQGANTYIDAINNTKALIRLDALLNPFLNEFEYLFFNSLNCDPAIIESELETGINQETGTLPVSDPLTESLSQTAYTQQDVNRENVDAISDLDIRLTTIENAPEATIAETAIVTVTDPLTESLSQTATDQQDVNQENVTAINELQNGQITPPDGSNLKNYIDTADNNLQAQINDLETNAISNTEELLVVSPITESYTGTATDQKLVNEENLTEHKNLELRVDNLEQIVNGLEGGGGSGTLTSIATSYTLSDYDYYKGGTLPHKVVYFNNNSVINSDINILEFESFGASWRVYPKHLNDTLRLRFTGEILDDQIRTVYLRVFTYDGNFIFDALQIDLTNSGTYIPIDYKVELTVTQLMLDYELIWGFSYSNTDPKDDTVDQNIYYNGYPEMFGVILRPDGGSAVSETSTLLVTNPITESLTGIASFQSIVNEENVTAINELQNGQITPPDGSNLKNYIDTADNNLQAQIDALNTSQIDILDPLTESLSGTALTQNILNEQNKAKLNDLESGINAITNSITQYSDVFSTANGNLEILPSNVETLIPYTNINNENVSLLQIFPGGNISPYMTGRVTIRINISFNKTVSAGTVEIRLYNTDGAQQNVLIETKILNLLANNYASFNLYFTIPDHPPGNMYYQLYAFSNYTSGTISTVTPAFITASVVSGGSQPTTLTTGQVLTEDPLTESIDGLSTTQRGINESNVSEITNINNSILSLQNNKLDKSITDGTNTYQINYGTNNDQIYMESNQVTGTSSEKVYFSLFKANANIGFFRNETWVGSVACDFGTANQEFVKVIFIAGPTYVFNKLGENDPNDVVRKSYVDGSAKSLRDEMKLLKIEIDNLRDQLNKK